MLEVEIDEIKEEESEYEPEAPLEYDELQQLYLELSKDITYDPMQ